MRMTCTFLAKFRIKSNKQGDFVALAKQMELNSGDEPETLAYKFYRLDEPCMYAVFESFTSEAGDLAHQQNPANVALIDDIIACMDGTYSREYLRDI
jgi:autoinducer 2-degrading protein